MKLRIIVYAPTAVEQFIYRFNRENITKIKFIKSEVIDGTPFVTIDDNNISKELLFDFAYRLGTLQKDLAVKGESWLPIKDYPFPPKEDEFNK